MKFIAKVKEFFQELAECFRIEGDGDRPRHKAKNGRIETLEEETEDEVSIDDYSGKTPSLADKRASLAKFRKSQKTKALRLEVEDQNERSFSLFESLLFLV